MFLSKLALYGSIAGTFFAVSAFSTIQISKYMNKTPVPNETEEEEDDLYVREMSDTERFINELTNFGNMEGRLNLSINKGDYNLALRGDVFVSMESMDDIKVDADITINTLGKEFFIEATYLEGTAYVSLEGNNLKLNTNSLGEVIELFSTADSSLELPDAFKNIDSSKLLTNLSAMTAEKSDSQITYTCNLIEGIPPLIFTSTLDYKMTSISLSNFDFEGFKINVSATTNILGKGHNRVVSPETSLKPYTDITGYTNVLRQLSTILNNQAVGFGYDVSIKKNSSNFLRTEGNANISFKNQLALDINGTLYNSDESKTMTYGGGLDNNRLYFNLNNNLKVRYDDIANLKHVINTIKAIINNPDVMELMGNATKVDIPVIQKINNKDYAGLLNEYKGLVMTNNQISLSMSNSLFGEDNTNFALNVNFDNQGITNITLSNLKYKEYALSFTLTVNDYVKPNVDLSTYQPLDYANDIFDTIFNIVDSNTKNDTQEVTLGLSGSLTTKDNTNITLDGSSSFRLGETSNYGAASVNIVSSKHPSVNHKIDLNVDRAKAQKVTGEFATEQEKKDAQKVLDDVAKENSSIIFEYSNNLPKEDGDKETFKGTINFLSISNIIDAIGSVANADNPRFAKYEDLFATSFTSSTLGQALDGNIEPLLFDDSLKSLTYNANEHYYEISLGSSFLSSDLEDDIQDLKVRLNYDVNNEFESISFNGKLLDYTANLTITMDKGFDSDLPVIDGDGAINFSSINHLADRLVNTATYNDFALSGDVSLGLGSLASLSFTAYVHIDENENVTAKITIERTVAVFWTRVSEFYIQNYKDSNGKQVTNIYQHIDPAGLLASDEYYKYTGKDFSDHMLYYIVNRGIGISTGIFDGRDTNTDSNASIDYSNVLNSYDYYDSETKWVFGLNLANLANNDSFGNATITITGNNKTLSSLRVVAPVSILTIDMTANVNGLTYESVASKIANANTYINNHKGDNYTLYDGSAITGESDD